MIIRKIYYSEEYIYSRPHSIKYLTTIITSFKFERIEFPDIVATFANITIMPGHFYDTVQDE